MASNTQNLNLYKADPVADANDTFNIDTLVNDNWDKIDQKAGEQENKLTALENEVQQPEYSGVLTQNKPVFSVGTGYDGQGKYVDVGDSVVKGQFSDLKLEGNTYVNLLQNGNFESTNLDWITFASVLSVNNNTMSITGDGTNSVCRASLNLGRRYNNNSKIFTRMKLKITNANLPTIRFFLRDGPGGTAYTKVRATVTNAVENTVYTLSSVTTLTADTINNLNIFIDHLYTDNATANGSAMEVQEVLVIDLDQHPELQNLTADQIDERITHWFDGTKSINSVRIKSESQNRFNKNTATLGYDLNQLNGEVAIKVDRFVSDYIKVKDGMQITLYKPIRFVKYDLNKQYVSGALYGAVGNQTISITDDGYIRFSQFISDIDLAFANNGTLTTFTKHDFSEMYVNLPEGVDALRSLLNGTKDEVKEGKLYKRISEDYAITSGLFTALVTLTNVDLVLLDLRNQAPNILKSANPYKVLIKNSSEIVSTLRDNIENIGKFHAATGTTEGSVYLIIAKGQYPNLATAQANIINDYSLTTLTYQLAEEKVYDMNLTPLTCYPNGTLIVEPWRRMVLDGSLAWEFYNDEAGFKSVYISHIPDNGVSDGTGQAKVIKPDAQELLNGGILLSDSFAMDKDWGYELSITISDADSGWAETYTPTPADIKAYFNAHPYILEYATDPSQTTLPTISYKSPINAAAQRDSNTNAIAQNARILTNHMTKQNAVNLSFDFRITALEP